MHQFSGKLEMDWDAIHPYINAVGTRTLVVCAKLHRDTFHTTHAMRW